MYLYIPKVVHFIGCCLIYIQLLTTSKLKINFEFRTLTLSQSRYSVEAVNLAAAYRFFIETVSGESKAVYWYTNSVLLILLT